MHDDSATGGTESILSRTFDPETTDPVEAVFDAVASTERIDLTTAAPLASVVEPDALDAIFGRDAQNDSVEVHFDYEGLGIVVTGTGLVQIIDRSRGQPAAAVRLSESNGECSTDGRD